MSRGFATEQTFMVGQATVIECAAPGGRYTAVFEDDTEVGYFYALDTSAEGEPIQDALHIYDVAKVTDRSIPSTVKVVWSVDSRKVVLFINDCAHAVFDFQAKQGSCRTGSPAVPHDSQWSAGGHAWNETAIEFFA
jgi:hypothetical protein